MKTLNHNCFVLRMGRNVVGPVCCVMHVKEQLALLDVSTNKSINKYILKLLFLSSITNRMPTLMILLGDFICKDWHSILILSDFMPRKAGILSQY